MILPGEAEAGNAGTQPCRGITRWAHRDDDRSAEVSLLRSSKNHIGSVDPDASKIPARRAEYSLTESALSPFQAEPTHCSTVRFESFSSCRSVTPSDPKQYDGLEKFLVMLVEVRHMALADARFCKVANTESFQNHDRGSGPVRATDELRLVAIYRHV